MNIVTSTEDGVTTLTLDDRFDAHEVPAYRAAMAKVYAPRAIVRLDLGAIRFLDSTALAELLRSRTKLLEVGGRLLLQPVSDPVRVLLELTALDQVFELHAPTATHRA